MDEQRNRFSITALAENARKQPFDPEFTKEYARHIRLMMAATQREIDEAMALNPDLRDMRF
jgi:hypothetical protein